MTVSPGQLIGELKEYKHRIFWIGETVIDNVEQVNLLIDKFEALQERRRLISKAIREAMTL